MTTKFNPFEYVDGLIEIFANNKIICPEKNLKSYYLKTCFCLANVQRLSLTEKKFGENEMEKPLECLKYLLEQFRERRL